MVMAQQQRTTPKSMAFRTGSSHWTETRSDAWKKSKLSGKLGMPQQCKYSAANKMAVATSHRT